MTRLRARAWPFALVVLIWGLAACQPADGTATRPPDPGPPAEVRALVRAIDLPGALPGLMADLVTAGDRDNLRRPGYAEAVADFEALLDQRRAAIDGQLAATIADRLSAEEQRAAAVWLEGEAAAGFAAEMRSIYLESWDEYRDTGDSALDTDSPETLAPYGVEDPLMQRLYAATLAVAADVIAETARGRAAAAAGA